MTDRLSDLTVPERIAYRLALGLVRDGYTPISAFSRAAECIGVDWRRITGPFILVGVDVMVREKTSGALSLDDIQAALDPTERTSP